MASRSSSETKRNGINHEVLNWISYYLSKRSKSVFVGNSSSKAKYIYISAGVQQGSALGRLFFLILLTILLNHYKVLHDYLPMIAP